MKQNLINRKKKFAIMTVLLLFVSLLFVNVKLYSKNAAALDSGVVLCAGGGSLDCNGFPAKVIIWLY
jgi:hypothetical protein